MFLSGTRIEKDNRTGVYVKFLGYAKASQDSRAFDFALISLNDGTLLCIPVEEHNKHFETIMSFAPVIGI